jgi:hypothetical protein
VNGATFSAIANFIVGLCASGGTFSNLGVTGNVIFHGALIGSTLGTAPKFFSRAWINFDGSSATPTIRGSVNVSSITDYGVGNYGINYTTAMGNTNYALTGIARRTTAAIDTNVSLTLIYGSTALGTTYGRVLTGSPSTSGAQDTNFVMVVVHA